MGSERTGVPAGSRPAGGGGGPESPEIADSAGGSGATAPIIEGIRGRVRPGPRARVLWLHGYTLDSSSWEELWSRLPEWHHIGIDLPGHGASAPIASDASLPELGRRLGEFCVEHDIRHVVALSFGTITAIQIAIEFPRQFTSLVLGAPALAGGPQDPEVGVTYARLFELYRRAGAAPGPEVRARMRQVWMSCCAWDGVEKRPGLSESLGGLVERHTWAELASYAIRQFTYPPQEEHQLARIEASTLVLVGDRELSAFRECAAILERTVPRCARCELEDTGHLCMLQSPEPSAEAIAAHLRACAG